MNKLLIFVLFFLVSCASSTDDIDDEYPQILNADTNTYPENCQVLYRNESFALEYLFKDNNELSSFSVEIHNNFDHHSHSTDITKCDVLENKKAINPFHFLQIYDLDSNTKEYRSKAFIFIPADIDTGDYHLIIRLTDTTGWETIKGISINISDK